MNNIKVKIKNISKFKYGNKAKYLYYNSNVIPFYNNYEHYLKLWSNIITDYGSISFVDEDGSTYEDYLLCKYNYNLEQYLYFFDNSKRKFNKSKIKYYCRKYDTDLKFLSKHPIYNKRLM